MAVAALELVLLVLATGLVSFVKANDYTQEEEVEDSIPVAITILVILILLVLVFVIILLIVCIRLMNRNARKKDIEETPMTTYNKPSNAPAAWQSQPQNQQQPPPQSNPQGERVVYVAAQPQSQPSQPSYVGYVGQQQPTTARPKLPMPGL